MRVRVTVAVAGIGWSYMPGGEADLPDEVARDLIAAGYAEGIARKAAPRVEDAKATPRASEATTPAATRKRGA